VIRHHLTTGYVDGFWAL